jgi:hypothetical protein
MHMKNGTGQKNSLIVLLFNSDFFMKQLTYLQSAMGTSRFCFRSLSRFHVLVHEGMRERERVCVCVCVCVHACIFFVFIHTRLVFWNITVQFFYLVERTDFCRVCSWAVIVCSILSVLIEREKKHKKFKSWIVQNYLVFIASHTHISEAISDCKYTVVAAQHSIFGEVDVLSLPPFLTCCFHQLQDIEYEVHHKTEWWKYIMGRLEEKWKLGSCVSVCTIKHGFIIHH